MLKIVALVEKRADLTWDEFVEYWDEEHVKVVSKSDTLQKYTIAPAIKPEDAAYDGIAELYFESTADIEAGFPDDLSDEIADDEAEFVANIDSFVAAEQTQLDRR